MYACCPFVLLALAITSPVRADQSKAKEVSNNLKLNILIITADNLGYGGRSSARSLSKRGNCATLHGTLPNRRTWPLSAPPTWLD